MIYRTPQYCRDFRCIAGDCRDSCCRGWEIDIDSDTYGYYMSVGGEFGERLRNSIQDGCFTLTEDERCPFLNEQGLCDIYTELGGDKLCQICSDHPRYFEWFGAFKEGGVGLCCEAAARLILSRPFALCEEEVPFESASGEYDEEILSLLLDVREEMFAVLGDETIPLDEALCRVLDIAEEAQQYIDMPAAEAAETVPEDALRAIFGCLEELEPIDENWLPYIQDCKAKLPAAPAADSAHLPYLRRIAQYLIFRYLLKSVYDGEVLAYAKFGLVSVIVISSLYRCKAAEGTCGFEECADIAKNYSKEVEYSDENMEQLIELFRTEDYFSCTSLKKLLTALTGDNVGRI
ncbi:flagellin lysine-N-methylase [Ruminococcus flavefaciens]|uniref:flagellin lysine-N-methylase n=1 Tax=Ruminococcus flavefaciens TaxID=1265 RepID=UPI0026EB9743|nr:flagellin lysine-N-methylase [Ruminococcus flavefaciens]